MYGLSKETDLTFLQGRKLELICFAIYQVNLHFDSNVLITIEGAFEHHVQGEALAESGQFPLSTSRLMRLLEQHVREFQSKQDGTLTLEFSNEDKLVIHGDNGPYESYHIIHGGQVIHV